ncbi:MAG: hypothetical protein ACNA8W_15715 [Bradymonadaceae bacterium]
MRLKHPENTVFNVSRLLPLPIFVFMVVVVVNVFLDFARGEVEGWMAAVAAVLLIYLGARSFIGVRQAVDFSKEP